MSGMEDAPYHTMSKNYIIGGRFGETLNSPVQIISFIPTDYWLLKTV